MENVKGMMNKIEEIKQNFEEYLGGEYQYDYALFEGTRLWCTIKIENVS